MTIKMQIQLAAIGILVCGLALIASPLLPLSGDKPAALLTALVGGLAFLVGARIAWEARK